MEAKYTPPYTHLGDVMRELHYLALDKPQEITYDELFGSGQNHFHVKIRYDENGKRLKTPIEFNARFPIQGNNFVGPGRGPKLGLTKYIVTMIKDDGTTFDVVDLHPKDANYNTQNVWYYPILTLEDIDKWVTHPSKQVEGQLVKYKYTHAITSTELERGFNYIVKFISTNNSFCSGRY